MKNIIIAGGELFNKGAQSMIFVTVDEMRKRFPNHQILILSPMDLQRPERERVKYNFQFIGWYPPKFARCQKNIILRLFYRFRHTKEFKECERIYKNCEMLIDISGYALGANWGNACCNVYLEHLEFAKAFHIPFYLMPQSFGPFEFEGIEGKKIDQRIRAVLPEAKVICAREQEGYDALLHHYRLNNVRLATDLVLNNKGIDLKNIYKEIPEFELPEIRENGVAIIPNGRTVDIRNQETVLLIYQEIISELLREEKTVYILRHATPDGELCKKIKTLFKESENVIFVDRDFSCLDFNEIVKCFQFLVASRFHSIVHAYKNGIPCIAIGWAVKYQELLEKFGQEQYMFDVREDIDIDSLIAAIHKLNEDRITESLKIKDSLAVLQRENIFDILSL